MASDTVVKTSMASIGERLKKAREAKSLTIDQVRKQTHIYSAVLSALEDGRCDEMLTATYVRSFLKTYATHLGLDAKQILKEYSILHPEGSSPGPSLNRAEEKEPFEILKFIYLAGLSISAIALAFFVIFLGSKTAGALKKRPLATREVAITTRAKRLTPSKSPSQKAAMSKIAPAAKEEARSKKGPFELVLKVRHNVYVKVRKDGTLLFERVLPKGSRESFRANEKIDLYVAKAESVEIVVDGKNLGSPGKGIIKNIEITKKGFKVR